MMGEVMKASGINVGEAKIGKILGEINPEAQREKKNVTAFSAILNNLVKRFITFRIRNCECLELFVCVLEMDFLVK